MTITEPVSPLQRVPGEQLLTGWGRTCPSLARVVRPSSVDEIRNLVAHAGSRGVLARGLGRSYGDAAQDSGGVVLDMTSMADITLDPTAGTVTCGAGASIDQLLRTLVPAGYFVPVTPGTRMITVGGAIAADVHGKNHHVDGSFGAHVQNMDVVNGAGKVVTVSPKKKPDQFWATVGGMGLTGVVTQATFDLIPITSSMIAVDTDRLPDLDAVMASMVEHDAKYRYSVAWIDSVSSSGRGIITRGDHAPAALLTDAGDPLAYDPKIVATAPAFIPSGLLNKLTVRAFNEAWFRKAPKHRVGELQPIGEFFHPLDGVQEWNRVYGPGGFVQYQFVVPDAAGYLIAYARRRLREVGAPSFLTVLKRFGAANPAPLSFPQPGWTLAADVPARIDGLGAVLDELDELVAGAGGRLYFAKDSRQSSAMVLRTYPQLDQWRSVRQSMDPRAVFTSDLARRLGL